MIKRFYALVVCGALVVSMVGCGPSSDTSDSSSNKNKGEALILYFVFNGFKRRIVPC